MKWAIRPAGGQKLEGRVHGKGGSRQEEPGDRRKVPLGVRGECEECAAGKGEPGPFTPESLEYFGLSVTHLLARHLPAPACK